MENNRRQFIGKSILGMFGILPLSSGLTANSNINNSIFQFPIPNKVYSLYPSEDPNIIREVVGASHTQLDKLKGLVKARPELAKATHDWGFGDWESALGAASHMGRKDIAEFLIEYGARPTIFTFAMLGKLEAVKTMIDQMPGIQRIRGPHGFTLMHHAKIRLMRKNVEGAEKQRQEELVKYLTNLGEADEKAVSQDISTDEQKQFFGKYTFGNGDDEFFIVQLNSRGVLYLSRGEYIGRSLLRTDSHSFSPGGAPSVRIVFEVLDGVARSFTIHDPVPVLKAVRIA